MPIRGKNREYMIFPTKSPCRYLPEGTFPNEKPSKETVPDAIQQSNPSRLPHSRPDDRRRDARYATNDPAEVEVLHANVRHLSALVLDVSRSGIRLGIQERIAPGSQVKVTMPRQVVIFGEIRYCRRAGARFHAGVLIQQVF
jgi:hypothetical protein